MRRGRGFAYVDGRGQPVRNRETVKRLRSLAVPPAWKEVWICADPLGHLQATGIDAAGRKQYLYHPLWRERRDHAKFERMVRFARALPNLRRRVAVDLKGAELNRDRVLACAVRLLDVGLFRIGSEEYANEEGGLGVTTLRKNNVRIGRNSMLFDYRAKGGLRRVHVVDDADCFEVIRKLKRRRSGPPELLAHREGGSWVSVRSDDVSEYLKERLGEEFSAKDFRTWNATVLAAVALAAGRSDGTTARKRTINDAVRGVAELLGNTPRVARRSYIDPRVFDRYLSGWTIAGAVERIADLDATSESERRSLERAVLDLLADDHGSAEVTRVED